MGWLNYHHLLYFWTVARVGTIAAASKELHLSQPTISAQLKTLESSLGQKLFQRQGRRLALTDVGRTAYRFADDIFRLGRELQQSMANGSLGETVRFSVGVADVIPKLIAEQLLQPALETVPGLQLHCHEGPVSELLGKLALHELDVVLSDAPAPHDIRVRAFSHALGASGTSLFATPAHAALKRGFPKSLQGAPFLHSAAGTDARHRMDQWLANQGLQPKVVGVFDDSALMKAFGARGLGVFAAPTVIEEEVCRQFDVVVVGRLPEVKQEFFAISVERRLRHPATVAVAESARRGLFS